MMNHTILADKQEKDSRAWRSEWAVILELTPRELERMANVYLQARPNMRLKVGLLCLAIDE